MRPYSTECAGHNRCREENIDSPLQFVTLVIHGDQIDRACIGSEWLGRTKESLLCGRTWHEPSFENTQ